ncbi:MAG TPA: ComEC/Rec2 family competence protein [Methylomirabilota bacterium]|nr:ComEC/Rec2 family competence protein [Methylomirabilota bacterium]
METSTKNLLKFFILPLLLLAIVLYVADRQISPDFLLHVDFLDVGQGDSIFIQTYQGRQMVIDGGPSDQVLSELGKVMPFFDRSIDVLMLTHPDADHVSGFSDILKRYKVGKVLITGVTAPTAAYRSFASLVDQKHIEKIYIHEGDRVWLDNATVFDIYYPPQSVIDDKSQATNDTSINGKLSFGKTSFFFTGDASSIVDDYIVPRYNLDSDVLKVPHHGSKTSTSTELLQDISPKYAVIEVGAKNNYGHPTQEVLDRLKAIGAQILRTDQDHTIKFTSDGTNLVKQ